MLSTSTLSKLSVVFQANRPFITRIATRSVATNACRIAALCKANSNVLSQNIAVIDNLINKNRVNGANEIFTKQCPVVGTTMGKQFRHELEHLEKVALDGLGTVRDSHPLVDLHYDVRERGTLCETDICEARDRCLFIQNIFDGVVAGCEAEGAEEATTDGLKKVTAYFTLPATDKECVEVPLTSTLEREMGFVCHHAIHHNRLVKAMAAAGQTGLSLDDLPPEFGQAPTTLVQQMETDRAA